MYKEYQKFLPEEILVYLRKSRTDDPTLTVEEVLEKHEGLLKEWQERNLDAPVPEENIYREVVSGETINSRPEFKKLLKRIESPKIKAVLVVECLCFKAPCCGIVDLKMPFIAPLTTPATVATITSVTERFTAKLCFNSISNCCFSSCKY